MLGNIFNFKKIVTKPNGESIMDLSQRSIGYKTDKINIETTVLVTDRFKMRPDLVSQAAWGSFYDADLLLKYNGISNPFTIDVGELLIVPSLSQMKDQLFIPETESLVLPKKSMFKVFKNLFKKKYNERSKNKLSPNLAEPGSVEIEFKDGMIEFGPNVSKTIQPNQSSANSETVAKIKK